METESNSLGNAVYELVFLLSKGNPLIRYLGLISFFIEYIQVLAFSFSLEGNLDWQLPGLQRGLFLAVAPWPTTSTTFLVASAMVISLMLILLLLLFQEVAFRGVRTISLLQGGRVVISLFSTVLFSPMIEIFISFAKDTLMDYLTNQNSISEEEFYLYFFLSLAICVLFVCPLGFFCFLCFSPDPLDNKELTAKVSTRPEILNLLGRVIMVLNSNFVWDSLVRGCIHFTLMLGIMSLYAVYPCYVNRNMNYLNVWMMGSVVWVSLVAIAVAIFPPSSSLQAIIALAGIPVSGTMAFYMMHTRFTQLNPLQWLLDHQYQVLNVYLSENQVEAIKKSLREFVITRCWLPTDIEIASRSCMQFELVPWGRCLFEMGLEKFPHSTYLYCRYTMYLVFVAKPPVDLQSIRKKRADGLFPLERLNPNKLRPYSHSGPENMSFMSTTSTQSEIQASMMFAAEHQRNALIGKMLKNAFSRHLTSDLRYIFYYLINQLEQHLYSEVAGVRKLTLIDSVRFKHDLQMATQHHKRALRDSSIFWSLLAKEESCPFAAPGQTIKIIRAADSNFLWHFAHISNVFYYHCQSAESFYLKLITKYPTSEVVGQRYSMFLKSVMNNEKAGNEVLRNVAFARAERRRISNQHRGSVDHPSAERRDDAAGYDGGGAYTGNNNFGTFLSQAGKSGKKETKRKYRTIIELGLSMALSILVIQVGIIVVHLYGVQSFLSLDRFSSTNLGPSLALTQQMMYQARQLEILCTFGPQQKLLPDFSTLSSNLQSESSQLLDLISNAKENSNFFSGTKDAWVDYSYTITQRTSSGALLNRSSDAVTLLNLFCSYSSFLAKKVKEMPSHCRSNTLELTWANPAGQQQQLLVNNSYWVFLMDNGKDNVVKALQNILLSGISNNQNLLEFDYKVNFFVGGIAGLLPLLVILTRVSSSFRRMMKERVGTLSLFCNLPQDGLRELAELVRISRQKLEVTIQRHESSLVSSNYLHGSARASGTTSSGPTSHGSGSTGLDTASVTSDDTYASSMSFSFGGSRNLVPVWVKVFIVFVLSIGVQYALLAGSTIMMYNASQSSLQSSMEITYADFRTFESYRLLVLCQELIRNDPFMWSNITDLKSRILSTVEEGRRLQSQLLYGDASLRMQSSYLRYQAQDDLTYQFNCNNIAQGCGTFEGDYYYNLEMAKLLLYYPNNSLDLSVDPFSTMAEWMNLLLYSQLIKSRSLYQQEMVEVNQINMYHQNLMFGFSFPISLLVLLVFIRMVQSVRKHIDASRHLLEIVPLEHALKVEPLRRYLKRGIPPEVAPSITASHKMDLNKMGIMILAPFQIMASLLKQACGYLFQLPCRLFMKVKSLFQKNAFNVRVKKTDDVEAPPPKILQSAGKNDGPKIVSSEVVSSESASESELESKKAEEAIVNAKCIIIEESMPTRELGIVAE